MNEISTKLSVKKSGARGLDRIILPEDLPPVGDYTKIAWRQMMGTDVSTLTSADRSKYFNRFLKVMLTRTIAFTTPKLKSHAETLVTWIPGHKMYRDLYTTGRAIPGVYRPEKAKIMVIGKMLGKEEDRVRLHWAGPAGQFIYRVFKEKGINTDDVYCTNIIKFNPPFDINSIPKVWLNEASFFIEAEIKLVQPEYILIFGADALKALFGTRATLHRYAGRCLEYGGAKVMVVSNPADILRNPEKEPGFLGDIQVFANLSQGKDVAMGKCTYEALKTESELCAVVDKLLEEGADNFAMDCEWLGENPHERKAHLLTVQFCCKEGHAYVVVMQSDVSGIKFDPSPSRAAYHLRRLLCRPNVKISGHNFRADLKWLVAAGVDIRRQFSDNGFDTMLADHALQETIKHDLTSCTLRNTDKGRYDHEVVDLLADRNTRHADIPDNILWQYAADDADATFRLVKFYEMELWKAHVEYANAHDVDPDSINLRGKGVKCKEWIPTLWNLFFEIIMRVNLSIHEIEMEGFLTDRKRMTSMVESFAVVSAKLLERLRHKIGDPHFNVHSHPQSIMLLFGPPEYADVNGNIKMGLGLTPVKATGKRGELWSKLIRKGLVWKTEEHGWCSPDMGYRPSTTSEVCGILADQSDEAALIRDIRYVDQICNNFLRKPTNDPNTGEPVYLSGLLGLQAEDGRIRTCISQLTKTGRWKSSRPNLQNIPKGREGDLAAIFRTENMSEPPLRSCFMAAEGNVLIEADFKSAEMFTLAYIAGDDAMKADLSTLDEDGELVSLHSTMAVELFKLGITVGEFDKVRKGDSPEAHKFSGLRVAAKSVNFGIPYQRGGPAIAREVRREGVDCSDDDGQIWVDTWYARYRKNAEFIKKCKSAVYNPCYVDTPWGRRRRFSVTEDEGVMKGLERESSNFP